MNMVEDCTQAIAALNRAQVYKTNAASLKR